jgi:cell division transport system permease protein
MIRFSVKHGIKLMAAYKRLLTATVGLMGLFVFLIGMVAFAVINIKTGIRLNQILFLAGSVCFAALAFISVAIMQLVLFGQKNEMDIMRLAGATDAYVDMPVYFFSIVQSGLGGITGCLALYLVYQITTHLNGFQGGLFASAPQFMPLALTTIFIFTSVGAGWLGGHWALKHTFRGL